MQKLLDKLQGFGISPAGFLVILVTGIVLGLTFFLPSFTFVVLSWAVATAPIWAPVALAVSAWRMWIWYIQALFISSQKYTLLEIRIPRDVSKSPRAMELFLTGIYLGIGETTFIQRLWEGRVRPWFSLEITSFGGEIHFYIWTRAFLKDIIEAQLYAQFPDIEIFEVEDYAARFHYDPSVYSVWGCDFKKDFKDVYPIKTYVSHQLDGKIEEGAIDPLAQVLEYLSQMKPGEQLWLQIMIRTNKDRRHKKGTLFGSEPRWKNEAQEEIAAIRERSLSKVKDPVTGQERAGFPNPTPADRSMMEGITQAQGKQPFDTGIRGVYIAEKNAFRAVNISGLTGIWRPFTFFGAGMIPTRWLADFDYPWEDYKGIRHERSRTRLIDAYRRRSWFFSPYQTPHYVMNTEEIATIFRFPSAEIKSPGIRRAPSAKSEPPPNLPL